MSNSSDLFAKGQQTWIDGKVPLTDPVQLAETVDKQFLLAMRFDTVTGRELTKRLTDPLEELEVAMGMNLLLAGRDFPWHSTVVCGAFVGEEEGWNERFEKLVTSSAIFDCRKSGAGKTQIFDNFGLDTVGNGLLVCDTAADWLTEMRAEAKGLIVPSEEFKIGVPSWAHCTVFRTLGFNPEKTAEFAGRVAEMAWDIHQGPFYAGVAEVWVGKGNLGEIPGL